MNQYFNNSLAKHFGINKTKEFINQKYNWLSIKKDIEAYIKGFDIYLALKKVNYKLYGNF